MYAENVLLKNLYQDFSLKIAKLIHGFICFCFPQVPTEPQKPHGRGNHNSSSRQSNRQHKAANKHNPNAAPSFHGPLPFHQPPIPPVYGSIAPWPPHIPVHGYAYPPAVGSFSPANGNMAVPPLGNPSNYAGDFPNRRPNVQENQKPLGPKENNDVQQNAGPRAFIRPPFFGPPAGFMGGPTFPGNFILLRLKEKANV